VDDSLKRQYFVSEPRVGLSIKDVFAENFTEHEINETIKKVGKNEGALLKADKFTLSISKFSSANAPHFAFIIEPLNFVDQSKALAHDYLINIIRYSPGFMYLKDTKFQYVMCNENFAEAAGLVSPEDIVGKTDFELAWARTEAELFRQGDIEALSGVKKINFEEPQLQADGSTRIVLANKVPLYDSQNNIIGILGNYLNITERKKLEKELQQAKEKAEAASRAKTQFITNMSHDIRTPLSGIVGLSEWLEDTASSQENRQQAKWIHESGKQLLELLNNILDVVSADNLNEGELQEEVFDLPACLHDLIALERPSAELKGLLLTLELSPKIPQYVRSDRMKLHRILLNLMGNAIKFTKEGCVQLAVKHVSSSKNQATLEFRITDTGIGIPTELQDQVFERFFRANPSYKGLYTGYGVGLHIAQAFAQALGSSIKLESIPNKGSTFYFQIKLNLIDSKEAPNHALPLSAKIAPPKAHHPSPTPMHVLLVEDNTIALKMAQNVVSRAGCQVTVATDGEQALELAQSQPFDLIITDIGLPGISGYELTKLVRTWETQQQKPPTPIIGLTAHAKALSEPECLQAGMNDVWTKPITLSLAKEIINSFTQSPVMQDSN